MSKINDETVVEILLRAKRGESPTKLSKEYGVGLTTIKRWRRGTQRVGKHFDPESVLNQAKKIQELEDKIDDLRMIIDTVFALKKENTNT